VNPDDLAVVRSSSAHIVVDDVDPVGGAIALDSDAEHHLFRVLRIRDGEMVTITDGRGSWRVCRAAGAALAPDGGVRRSSADRSPLTIMCAIPKRDRPEWIVQKLTELGTDRIVFLHADRSVVRWDGERAAKHVGKLQKVAAEALQQSRGVWLPTVDGPFEAVTVLPQAVAAEPGGRSIGRDDACVAIGPEGGWSERELAAAGGTVSLGSTILRVETAAMAAAVCARLR
jgi:16S rRNA (uracil1498-N3)-methyltransferase